MADPQLDVLQNRIDILEKRVFGDADKDAGYPKDMPQIIDTLANINAQVNKAVSGRPKVEALMKRLVELDSFLDPVYAEKLTLSNQAKTDIILAEEDLIRQNASNLEKIKEMSDVLGSEHVKGSKGKNAFAAVPSLEGKLQELCQIHIEQQDETSQLTEETKELLMRYNNIVTLLSKQFIQLDETVTQLEVASKPKKVLD